MVELLFAIVELLIIMSVVVLFMINVVLRILFFLLKGAMVATYTFLKRFALKWNISRRDMSDQTQVAE